MFAKEDENNAVSTSFFTRRQILPMTNLDRLRFVGAHGMGALRFFPLIEEEKLPERVLDLDFYENECLHILKDEESPYIDELISLNGSSCGAKPKILVSLGKEEDWLVITPSPKGEGF